MVAISRGEFLDAPHGGRVVVGLDVLNELFNGQNVHIPTLPGLSD